MSSESINPGTFLPQFGDQDHRPLLVDRVLQPFLLLSIVNVLITSVKTVLHLKTFASFKLVIYYLVLLDNFTRYVYISNYDFNVNVVNRYGGLASLSFVFFFSRFLMFTTYSLLLIFWIRLFHNVFKVQQAIFKMRHYTTYIFIIVQVLFLVIMVASTVLFKDNDKHPVAFSVFYLHLFLYYVVGYCIVLAIGFLIFGILLYTKSLHNGKVSINNRILFISLVLALIICLQAAYMIYAARTMDMRMMYIYRIFDTVSFMVLTNGVTVLLSKKPAKRKKSSRASGNSSGTSCEINLDVSSERRERKEKEKRKKSMGGQDDEGAAGTSVTVSPMAISPNNETTSNDDGIYSDVTSGSIQMEEV
ncbi:hypothetical protein SAMD00019534_106900, partial [Acytostelium subglobosum LB1]|uniref:hypothetical protein n=1 Tax=Acytostelium subglobosum LB1 TaxID=1410327 RepID=UPI000644E94F